MATAPASTDDLLRTLSQSFYSPSEVAAIARVSSSTVMNYIHSGRLPAVQLSERTYRVPRKALIRLLGLDAPPPKLFEDPAGEPTF